MTKHNPVRWFALVIDGQLSLVDNFTNVHTAGSDARVSMGVKVAIHKASNAELAQWDNYVRKCRENAAKSERISVYVPKLAAFDDRAAEQREMRACERAYIEFETVPF